MLGSPPETTLSDLHNKSLERRQRQIFPSTHMAPGEPPARDEMVEGDDDDDDDEEEEQSGKPREEEGGEPVLPSVRQLASRFQVTFFLFLLFTEGSLEDVRKLYQRQVPLL